MFVPGRIYRHKKCIDVYMQVKAYFNVRIYFVDWVQQKNHNFVYAENDRVVVTREDFKNWTWVG